MKTYSKAETDSFDDRAEWVPAEVAQGLYDALDDAELWVDSPHEIKRIQAALAAADGDSHEDAQTT